MRPEARLLRFLAAWIAANSVAEMLGLGIVFACGLAIARILGEPEGLAAHLSYVMLATALGAVEGAVVGAGQWLVLRGLLDRVTARDWIRATVAGAVLAWFIGMAPSTLMSLLSEPAPEARQPEPSLLVMLPAAAAMGLLAGLILSVFQWRELRKHVAHAGWWLPANALAWATAMPWIFWLVGVTVADQQNPSSFASFVLGLAVAGALVGAIHGTVLVTLLRRQPRLTRPPQP